MIDSPIAIVPRTLCFLKYQLLYRAYSSSVKLRIKLIMIYSEVPCVASTICETATKIMHLTSIILYAFVIPQYTTDMHMNST